MGGNAQDAAQVAVSSLHVPLTAKVLRLDEGFDLDDALEESDRHGAAMDFDLEDDDEDSEEDDEDDEDQDDEDDGDDGDDGDDEDEEDDDIDESTPGEGNDFSSPSLSHSPLAKPEPHLPSAGAITVKDEMRPIAVGRTPSANETSQTHLRADDDHLLDRRRRDVRAARDRLGEQFEQLRRVLPDAPDGAELTAKAQVLEHSVNVIHNLMKRARHLAIELAVVNPEATRRWVRNCADDGRKPLMHAVSAVMKLFAACKEWRYAEWWTLDEGRSEEGRSEEGRGRTTVVEDAADVHGCVVRDSVSVMRLGWTLIQRLGGGMLVGSVEEREEDEELARFAKASSVFEFKPRIGMPGRVWTSRRAEWLIDLGEKEIFLRSPLAKQFGMKTCLAVPIQFGGHVHSVMAFYSRDVRGYNPECYDLACMLSQCLEDIYSPGSGGPWQVSEENLFPTHPMR